MTEKKYIINDIDDCVFFAIKASDYELQTLTHSKEYITASFIKKKDKCCKDGGTCDCKKEAFGNNSPTYLAG